MVEAEAAVRMRVCGVKLVVIASVAGLALIGLRMERRFYTAHWRIWNAVYTVRKMPATIRFLLRK